MSQRPDNNLLTAFSKGRRLNFDNHELVLRAGESPKGVFYLAKGFVKVYSITEHGVENLHIIYKAGEVFPLVWAFKNLPRSVFYESLGPSELYMLPRDDFMELVKTSAVFNHELLEKTVDQFYVYADRLDNLQYSDARERVAYRLLFLAGRFGKKVGKTFVIEAPITHQHIAESINLARETVSREIEKLEHEGILGSQKRRLVLKDVSALEKITGEPTSINLWSLK